MHTDADADPPTLMAAGLTTARQRLPGPIDALNLKRINEGEMLDDNWVDAGLR